MSLRKQQSKFMLMLGKLIIFAYSLGFELTGGDLFAISGHKEGSFHGKRLAIDLNLFNEDGVYLQTTDAHQPLGEYWESLGGTWGGRFKHPDGNHYSLGE